MPRKQKPPARRAKKYTGDSPVYTTEELCVRYRIARRTLRRWTEQRGYPEGWISGKHMVYSKQQVHDWERVHQPQYHTDPELSEEDKKWELMRRRYQLEKEEREAGIAPRDPPPKPRRPPSRARA